MAKIKTAIVSRQVSRQEFLIYLGVITLKTAVMGLSAMKSSLTTGFFSSDDQSRDFRLLRGLSLLESTLVWSFTTGALRTLGPIGLAISLLFVRQSFF